MKLNIDRVKKAAKELGKECVYNRSTGQFQIKSDPLTYSEGVTPFRYPFEKKYGSYGNRLDISESEAEEMMGWL